MANVRFAQTVRGQVEAAVAALFARIADPEAPARRVTLESPLIVRSSARVPKGWSP